MLDTAGKILELIIHQRIEAAVDPQLASQQYGFRKGRPTLDAINLVVDTAKKAIAGARWKGVYMMVSSKSAWEATSSFATDVLLQLRCLERERAKTRTK
ncbi:unnamed protein product [Euphydryas editha]|uniref:Reverse transcriptase domain-containing protein n=1 Tax=Euphydryas editha TaxID=104508 RepID=A0AAU9U7Y2_EUPED|nr:unnamed protein product [Euphydryas editha]